MWVKICGNTNLGDALLAAELGADAVGFVFAPGKRTIMAEEVATITPHLPQALERIGVFTTTDFAEITSTAERAGLTGVQLHGKLDLALLKRLRLHFGERTSRYSVIQVLPWWTGIAAENQRATLAAGADDVASASSSDAILIDSRTCEASGGTGTTLDWAAAKDALSRVKSKLILAGGLHPGNVQEAIRAFQPWGVDVASGVELQPGRKDRGSVAAFIQNAKRVRAIAATEPSGPS